MNSVKLDIKDNVLFNKIPKKNVKIYIKEEELKGKEPFF